MTEGKETTGVPVTYREEDVLYRPAATSSSHWPISKHYVAEHLSNEVLARLLADNPAISKIVLKAKEDCARAIAASEVAERAEREQREREEPMRYGGRGEGQSGVAEGGGDGDQCRKQETGGEDVRHTLEPDPHAIEETGAAGPSAELVGSGTALGGPFVVGGSSEVGGSSGTSGDETGPGGSPPRDPARGKGTVTEGKDTTGVPVTYKEEDVLYRPAATSSSHWPINKHDVAEHLSDKALAKLFADNPQLARSC
ncbi:hypothetical protein RHMOL_Rhmol01G0153500 [Rhododendron molle]|uniref:Uncharacterized protein n=1 Tax=Rhododendron molle TaxID=49168 RepID=A0ACC0Q4R9_RHOML|nr:hypothetical protein RHMOL_Rhmol01G0153500 [Rhododendron molle]